MAFIFYDMYGCPFPATSQTPKEFEPGLESFQIIDSTVRVAYNTSNTPNKTFVGTYKFREIATWAHE